MFIWTAQRPRADSVGEPSPLLSHLAGPFAPRIAGLWPEPHRAFVEATAERRHLVCLALARSEEQLAPDLASACIAAPLRRAVKLAAPEGPEGLARALGRLGEIAWPAEDYNALVRLLGEPGACTVLHHKALISRPTIAHLTALSAPLRAAGLASAELSGPQAEILTELHAALAARDGEAAACAAARRWSAGNGAADIFVRAIASVRRGLSPPPFPDQGQLRAIRTLAQLDEAGGRFHNCLGSLNYAGDPDYAWYEWVGQPGAMIEITNDRLFGWTLRQALLNRNAAVPAGSRSEITAALRHIGVNVGRSDWDVITALRAARHGRPQTSVEEAIGVCFGDDD